MTQIKAQQNGWKKFFIILFRILFTAAVFASVAFIFYNSSQVADISSDVSGKATHIINDIISHTPWDVHIPEKIVRKLAHIAEFAVLGFFLTLCLRVYTKRLVAFSAWPMLLGLFVAVCDEFYQRFVPGRTGQIKDIFIDFIGVCGGTAAGICLVVAVQIFIWLIWGRKKKAKENAQ